MEADFCYLMSGILLFLLIFQKFSKCSFYTSKLFNFLSIYQIKSLVDKYLYINLLIGCIHMLINI